MTGSDKNREPWSRRPRCPYCLSLQDINHNDGYGLDESAMHRQQCHNCDNWYRYETAIRVEYRTSAAKGDALIAAGGD